MGVRRGDPRLTAFLEASSADEAERALHDLFDATTERVLAESVRRGLSGSSGARADVEDVIADTRVRLLRRLWAMRADADAQIDDFTAYVATAATRTSYAHLRSRFPARTRFRNQVRYCVSRHPDTRLEEDAAGVWQCRAQARLRVAPAAGATDAFLRSPQAFLSTHGIATGAPLAEVLRAVLLALDRPIALDRLVDALAPVLGVADAVPAAGGDGEADPVARVADPAPEAVQALTDREALHALWDEVVALPANQRVALLLNLRDPDGGSAVHALPATGLVDRRALAVLLDLSPAAFDDLWPHLPLDDAAIAARLGVTRQQVINLRKSARARLARRTGRGRS